MTLSSMVVSRDWQEVSVLECILGSLHIDVAVESEPRRALSRIAKSKVDALIVDCDLNGTGQFFRELRREAPRANTVPLVIMGGPQGRQGLETTGAMFAFDKPISVEQAEASLRAATALIKRERRRSFRVPVQVPIQLQIQDGAPLEGILLDLSEDGMDMLAAQPLAPGSTVSAKFNLPDNNTEIQVNGEIAWASPNGQAGVRFLDVSESLRATLKTWVLANAPETPPPDPEPVSQCTLTDLSLGGCYVETESPFPERSGITLCLKAEDMEVQAEGLVRVMHPGFGMGIEFAARTTDERAQVARFIGFLTSRPGMLPALLITPRILAEGDHYNQPEPLPAEELDDPLLELLRNGESLNQEEFLQQLRQQRSSEEVTSA